MKLFLTLAALVGFAYAGCPNGCSGHGSCGTSDVCGCYKGFFGGDCSYRHCPVGPSWTVTPMENLMDDRWSEKIVLGTPGGYVGVNKFDTAGNTYPIADFSAAVTNTFKALYPKRPNFNQYTECSSRGTCDYATGECKCFDGFEGRGCRRTSCPNGCSGHGRCLDNWDVNPTQYLSFNYPNDQFWDQKRTQTCKCDRGYSGYDCNSRICPFGDDPTSNCGENSAGDVQLVVTRSDVKKDGDGNTINYYFTLTFQDMFGGSFTTRPILDQKCKKTGGNPTSCQEVQYALMDLPNFAIPEVQVDVIERVENADTKDPKKVASVTSLYTVQFTDSSNAGKQNTLTCQVVDGASNNVDGAQPKFAAVAACEVYNVGGPEWFEESGEPTTLTLTKSFPELAVVGVKKEVQTKATVLPGDESNPLTTYEDFQPCASKGDCDGATGTCICNSGHYGEACEKQSTYY